MKTRISDLTVRETIDYLREIGDTGKATEIKELLDEVPAISEKKISEVDESPRLARARWRGTEHDFGYIDPKAKGLMPIQFAGQIDPDQTLQGGKVDIQLGGVFTMNYPGGGRHNVLMHFKANHAYPDEPSKSATIEFQQKFKSRENEGAGDMGNYVFLGLHVPAHGLEFEVKTVNINNDSDEAALKVLESDPVRKGLDLVKASIPSLSAYTKMGEGLLNLVLTRNRNKIVQEFTLGLNFNDETGPVAKLREGIYVAVQVRRDLLDWNDWVFDSGKGLVVHKNHTTRLPYNHIVFIVSASETE